MNNRLLLLLLLAFACDDRGQQEITVEYPVQDTFTVDDFSSAEACKTCHPNYFTEWTASMHSYSVADPVWMVSQQGRQEYHNANGVDIGPLCIQCHSPVSYLTDVLTDYSNITNEVLDGLPAVVREGLTCDICHFVSQIPDPSNVLVNEHQFGVVDYRLYTKGPRYGLITNPVENEFHTSEYNPIYDKSEYCQNCHNLSVNGLPAEVNQFEWEGTAFQAMGIECQTCHMPTYTGQAAENGPIRDDLHRHYFPGADEALIPALFSEEHRIELENLLYQSADINFSVSLPDTIAADTTSNIPVSIIVTNYSGHRFPTGVTFVRQLWLETVFIYDSDTLFESGLLDENDDISDFYVDSDKSIDPQLKLFNTVLYNEVGDSGLYNVSVEQVTSMSDYTLPTNGSKIVSYSIPLSFQGNGTAVIKSRLRFRAFPPFLLRHIGLQELEEQLHIFDLDSISDYTYLIQ